MNLDTSIRDILEAQKLLPHLPPVPVPPHPDAARSGTSSYTPNWTGDADLTPAEQAEKKRRHDRALWDWAGRRVENQGRAEREAAAARAREQEEAEWFKLSTKEHTKKPKPKPTNEGIFDIFSKKQRVLNALIKARTAQRDAADDKSGQLGLSMNTYLNHRDASRRAEDSIGRNTERKAGGLGSDYTKRMNGGVMKWFEKEKKKGKKKKKQTNEETLHELHKGTVQRFIKGREQQADIAWDHSQTAKKAWLGNSRKTGIWDPVVPRVVGQIGKIGQHNDALLQTATIFNQRSERAKASAEKAKKRAATMQNEEVVTEGKRLDRLKKLGIVAGMTLFGGGVGIARHNTYTDKTGTRIVDGSAIPAGVTGAGGGALIGSLMARDMVASSKRNRQLKKHLKKSKETRDMQNEEYTQVLEQMIISLTGMELEELHEAVGGRLSEDWQTPPHFKKTNQTNKTAALKLMKKKFPHLDPMAVDGDSRLYHQYIPKDLVNAQGRELSSNTVYDTGSKPVPAPTTLAGMKKLHPKLRGDDPFTKTTFVPKPGGKLGTKNTFRMPRY